MLREGRQGNQEDWTRIEVISELSTLYPLIEQRRDSLSRDLNDELESDYNESTPEDTAHDDDSHYDAADVYEPSLFSAQIRHRGRNDGSS